MHVSKINIKEAIQSIFFNITSIFIPILQYVPCSSIWFGIMSIPLISYLTFFFQYPGMLQHDFLFFFGYQGTILAFFGLGLYIFCLIFHLMHRKQLMTTGPYKIVRHPQYLAFIIMTLGLTLICFQTFPIIELDLPDLDPYLFIFYIWLAEVLAYIVLGKIEDLALKAKYRDEFIEYKYKVPFIIPFLKLKRFQKGDQSL
ncbi:MAG: isoprenylcysteine carboxylmethyltransferase family protein, partial [Candidatus Lokiarchaeota archaeon]|nr:isoprenylcysteine carboxylmethyltransferase family protein [Candidatus Lokiarchaeota archaeon]